MSSCSSSFDSVANANIFPINCSNQDGGQPMVPWAPALWDPRETASATFSPA